MFKVGDIVRNEHGNWCSGKFGGEEFDQNRFILGKGIKGFYLPEIGEFGKIINVCDDVDYIFLIKWEKGLSPKMGGQISKATKEMRIRKLKELGL